MYLENLNIFEFGTVLVKVRGLHGLCEKVIELALYPIVLELF